MRVPDRPRAETDADGSDSRGAGPDYRASSEHLAERLARLLAGHPSAYRSADSDHRYLHPDDLDPDDTGLEDSDGAYDLSPDSFSFSAADEDLDGEPLGGQSPDDLASLQTDPRGSAGSGLRSHHGPDNPTWDALGGRDHGSYRPWFSADSASDPWFAEPTDGAAR